MAGFVANLARGIKGAGATAGASMSKEFNSAFTTGSSLTAADKAAQSLALAKDKVAASSITLSKANNAEQTAADRLTLAQAKLTALQADSEPNAIRLAAAQGAVSKAERDQALAADQAALAGTRQKAAVDEQTAAQDRATASTKSGLSGLGLLTVATIGVAAVIGDKAVKAAGDFQSQLVRLTTSAGESTQNLNMVSSGILKIATDTGTGATDLANGMYTVESAGYHGADGLKVLKAAAQGAKEENADLGTVANAVTDILTDYHLPAVQAAGATSMLVETAAQGKTTFEALAGSMSSIAPLASAAHVPLQDMLGDIAEMTAHGVSADQATQNLAQAVRSLSNPLPSQVYWLGQYGISAQQLSTSLGKQGVSGAMEEVTQTILGKMGPSGTVLLNAFNQSKQAASNAQTIFNALPVSLQKVATEYKNGQISSRDWTLGLKDQSAANASLLKQWANSQNAANGFNQALKTGGTSSQTFTQALAKLTGNATSMNVALLLSGENALDTAHKIDNIAEATDDAQNNVMGWSEIQGNFNQQMDVTKSSLGAFMISLGQLLLPLVTRAAAGVANVAQGLAGMATWMDKNKSTIGPLAAVFGILVGAILAYRTAMVVTAIATKAWTIATETATAINLLFTEGWGALNAVMDANIFVIIAIAIAALVIGIIYAYNHFQTFHNIVNAVLSVIGSVFTAVFHAAEAAVSGVVTAVQAVAGVFATVGSAVGGAFVTGFRAVETAVRAVGAAFSWFWSTILQPIFNVISIAVRILVAIIITILLVPLRLGILALGALFTWLWSIAIGPALRWLQSAFAAFGLYVQLRWRELVSVLTTVWNVTGKPLINGIQWVIQQLGAYFASVFNGLRIIWSNIWGALVAVWNVTGKPLIAGISWAAGQLGAYFVSVFNGMRIIWQAVWAGLVAIWNVTGKPLFDGIGWALRQLGDFFNWLWNVAIKPIWNAIGWGIKQVYDDVIKPVFDGISWFLNALGGAFDVAVHAVGVAWDKIKQVAAVPINFILQYVYNDGIVWVWNKVADLVGLKNLELSPAAPIKFAEGGRVPGVDTGVDTVHAMVRPNEFVLVPGAAQAIGYQNLAAVNSAYGGTGESRAGHFDGGGLVNPTGSNSRTTVNTPTGNAGGLGTLLSLIGGAAADVVSDLTDPLGALERFVGNSSSFLQGIGELPIKMIKSFADWAWSKVTSLFGSSSAGGVIPTAAHAALLAQAEALAGVPASWTAGLNTLITRESGWNAGAINLTDSNAKAGHPSQGLMQTIPATFEAYRLPSLPDVITNPLANIVAGIRYILARYGDISKVQQANAALPPKGYDSGGYLDPGYNVVYNGLGVPEPVLTPAQLDSMSSSDGGSGDYQFVAGELTIAGDGLSAFVSGKIKKTSGNAATRVAHGFSR
jgi:TP901 family phage tail tape measure protein